MKIEDPKTCRFLFSIGRAPDNQQVLNDSQASGHHAVIHPEGQGHALVDQGSTNGTWVNGQRLESEKPHLLHSGDVICIGNTTFTYEVATTPITPTTVITPIAVTPPTPPSYAQTVPLPSPPLPNGTKGIYTLFYLNIGFTILGDFVFGISMIRAAVYPLWISIILLGVGSLNLIATLTPTVTVLAFADRLLTAALFCGWGLALMQQLPNRVSLQDLDKSYGVSRSGGPNSSASSK